MHDDEGQSEHSSIIIGSEHSTVRGGDFEPWVLGHSISSTC